jgi:hypothetical protein
LCQAAPIAALVAARSRAGRTAVDEILWSPLIQFRSVNACCTVRFFLHAKPRSAGAVSAGAWPLSHRSRQNLTCSPLPTVMTVQALNSSVSVSLGCSCNLDHGFGSFVHFDHCHHKRSALLKRSKSRTVRPPSFLGRYTLFQFTRQ